MQLLRTCPVGGDDLGRLRYGIIEGVIEGLEEHDVIHLLLRYSHGFVSSSFFSLVAFLMDCIERLFFAGDDPEHPPSWRLD
jgi:hypothetical protein